MQFAPLRAPWSSNVSCKNPAVLIEMPLAHFQGNQVKDYTSAVSFGDTHSLFLMHFTQISIRMIFKENNKTQRNIDPLPSENRWIYILVKPTGQLCCAEELRSFISEVGFAVLPLVSGALHILKWHLETWTDTGEPIIKGKGDMDYLEVNPEIIFIWTCKNYVSMHVSVYKPDAAPASLCADCVLLEINVLMGF